MVLLPSAAMIGRPFSHVPIRMLACCALALLIAACSGGRGAGTRAIELKECRLPKVALAAQCGELEVPENRAQPGGRKIRLWVAVLAANTLNPAPDPLFIVAGGPGQAASYLGPLAGTFAAVRRQRDIVFVDQRGTGRSSPLDCDAFHRMEAEDVALEVDPVPRAARCADELKAKGIDAAQYTTAAWIADLDAVRSMLDYERINLWGGSYGTRVALEYARRFGAHVRTMVLDGVAPPSLKVSIDVWPTRDAAINAAFEACRASAACRSAHGDPDAVLRKVQDGLATGGRDVTIADPRTGQTRSMRFTPEHVIGALQALVYLPEFASLIPETLHLAADGDLTSLYASTLLMTGSITEQLNSALFYSVTCTEDVPRITPEEREAKLANVRARALAEKGLAVCDVWPRGERTPGSETPVVSDVPTLLLSGGLDPVTPPAYGNDVAKTLRNAKHVVAAGYGHNVSPHACTPRLIAAFIEEGGFAKLPAACVKYLEESRRPPFWPDRLAPQP